MKFELKEREQFTLVLNLRARIFLCEAVNNKGMMLTRLEISVIKQLLDQVEEPSH